MNKNKILSISKYLSYLLRHDKEFLSVYANKDGFVSIIDIINNIKIIDKKFNLIDLLNIVENDTKQRFKINGYKIRASQGHSAINIQYDLIKNPPKYLYHGTTLAALKLIKNTELNKMSRSHVHLSKNIEGAFSVAERSHSNIILRINTKNLKIYKSENGVYLSDNIQWKNNLQTLISYQTILNLNFHANDHELYSIFTKKYNSGLKLFSNHSSKWKKEGIIITDTNNSFRIFLDDDLIKFNSIINRI